MASPQTLLRVGVGRRDITPPLGTPLMGYPNPQRTALSVRDPLHATALAMERDGVRAVVLSLDISIIADDLTAAIRAGVEARTGVPGANVTVCAIQTHSGPNVQDCWGWCDRNQPFLDRMVPAAIDAAAEAFASRRPAVVGIGTTQSQVGINRRQILEDGNIGLGTNPWAPYDPLMTVIRFENPDLRAAGQPATIATLINYGAHPTVFNAQSRVVSRDWPAVMIDRVEHFSKAPALFVNGAVGDIAPRCNTLGAVGDGEAALQEVGARAAMDAMAAWRDAKEFRDLPLACLVGGFTLPYRPLGDLGQAQRRVAELESRQNNYGGDRCEYLHARSVVEMHALQTKIRDAVKAAGPAAAEKFTIPNVNRGVAPVVDEQGTVIGKRIRQTITALGPVALVPFTGEPFAETVLRLRHHSPFQLTLAASTTNGCDGYFPTRDSLHRGGYEVWVAKAFGPYILAEHIDDVLFTQNLKLLRSLASTLGS